MKKSTLAPTPKPKDLASQWAQQYRLLSPREQLGMKCLGALMALGLTWLVLVSPASQLLRLSPDEGPRLAMELQQLRLLQRQAQDIRAQTRMGPEEAKKVLERITRNLLPQAQWTAREDAVQITLSATPALVLARWLQEVRESAQSTVLEANLRQSNTPLNPSTNTSANTFAKEAVLWQGVLVVGLPH